MAKSDGSVVIDTRVNTDGFNKGAANLKTQFTKVASSAAKMGVAIAAAFGVVAVGLVKKAVEAYADYEQLIGGAETLFKDSADKIMSYAENAFYSVGMGASEYLETVTSFSASLISSLGGDTAAAADVADMALTDMADNANKMGSSLESIKTAYQGFAKQQYMLLDNLKLGYGGTKTEMERLLKDAEAFSGVKYDINNLADVYEAINQIQIKLGIAGTTAKEAEKTITGAAGMTKAAWANVLKALAGGGDLDAAINNLVFSITKLFQNVMPVVQTALVGIGKLIEQAAPALVETVAAALIKAIPSLLNAIYQMIIGLAKGIYQGVVSLFTGATKTIEKQMQDTGAIADNNNAAADGAERLAEETEEAGKAAKKALAGFDELTILNNKSEEEEEEDLSTSSSAANAITAAAETTATQLASPLETIFRQIFQKIRQLIDPLLNIDFSPLRRALSRLGEAFLVLGEDIATALEWAWFNVLVPLISWFLEVAVPVITTFFAGALESLSIALDPVMDGFKILWEYLKPVFDWLADVAVTTIKKLGDIFKRVASVFQEKSDTIQKIFTNLGEAISGLMPALEFLKNLFFSVFDVVGNIVVEAVSDAIDALAGITDFLAGVFTLDFKRALNGLIGFVNGLISAILDGINFMIDAINTISFDIPEWIPGVGGQRFGFDIPKIPSLQIPYLAKGAVIPPNAPFAAILGDQRHGTNIEAPLSTIQEAVALVMEDYAAANIAGHEATVSVLREILEAVLGIHIGDDVVGQAVARYNARMAIIRGGSV